MPYDIRCLREKSYRVSTKEKPGRVAERVWLGRRNFVCLRAPHIYHIGRADVWSAQTSVSLALSTQPRPSTSCTTAVSSSWPSCYLDIIQNAFGILKLSLHASFCGVNRREG